MATEAVQIPFGDPRYPPLLAHAPAPPAFLYIRGNVGLLARADAVAVVGTRKMTRYGEAATREIVGALALAGVPIVSGLAFGVDAAAHEAALAAGGQTIAVLPSGAEDDDICPRSNFGLAKRILASGGAVISEYEGGTPSAKYLFLARNRIIAGMCRATIVIEAAEKSGALITASLALKADRDILAVPGNITAPVSVGPNRLIAQGATPAISAAYVLETLGITSPDMHGAAQTALLTDDERTVLAALRQGCTHPDDIAQKTGLSARQIAIALSALTLKGIAVN